MPLEHFSGPMRTIAFLTPHAWANEGFSEPVRHNGAIADVLPQLGVLTGYAVVLFATGAWLLRRRLTA